MQMFTYLFFASADIQIYLNFSDLLEETLTLIHKIIILTNDPKKNHSCKFEGNSMEFLKEK